MNINGIQRLIILFGMVIIIIMALFPPWAHTFKSRAFYREQPAGYSFIGSAPARRYKSGAEGIKIDTTRLFLQWFVTIFACSCCVILASKRKDE